MHFKDRKKVKAQILLISWVVLIIIGFCEEVFAPMRGSYPRIRPLKPPIILPPIRPVVPLPQFFNNWSITDVVNSFQGNGLEIGDIRQVTDVDQSFLPARVKEGIKFSIPSVGEEVAGCILSFNDKYNLEKVRKHYLGLNEKGEFYTWTFVKDNILLVLDGRLPESMAREYERALYDLKK
jgi:hypothetical protein